MTTSLGYETFSNVTVTMLRCGACSAPVDLAQGRVQQCSYCGAALTLSRERDSNRTEASSSGGLRLLAIGPKKISVIKIVREHTGLGLKESKELVEAAPVVVATWDDAERMAKFAEALRAAGARVD